MEQRLPGYDGDMPPEPLPDDTRLDITASDRHVYDVTISHPSGAETRHCVTVPERLAAELGVSDAQEPILVRVSLVYLLEHDPAAIPERFDLDEIGRAVPEYPDEIVARL
jgi:hypothetical protein